MIIDKQVEVKVMNRNVNHYINKIGYIPKYRTNRNGKKELMQEIISISILNMHNSSMVVDVECDNCGNITTKLFNEAIKRKSYCSKKCMQEDRVDGFLREFEAKIGEDAKVFLEREYVQNKKPFRQISIEVFGHDGYRNSLGNWCRKLNVKIRNRSEAVETQWLDNSERRKQNAELMRRVMNIEGIKKDHTVPELRKTSQYQEWRLHVYARDNFTCVKCGKPRTYSRKLNAHHLNSFMHNEDSRYDVDNGVTLCQSCHMKFHAKYTNRNNTREQFEEWIKKAK